MLILDYRLLGEIITSHPSFDPFDPPAYAQFARWWFRHPEFVGYGRDLLVAFGHTSQMCGFRLVIGRAVPDAAATWILYQGGHFSASKMRGIEDDPDVVGHVLHDDGPVLPLETLIDGRRSALLEEALSSLPERDRMIFTLYVGLDGEEDLSCKEVGSRHELSRSRTQQVVHGVEKLLVEFLTAYERRAKPKPLPPAVVRERRRREPYKEPLASPPIDYQKYAVLVAEHIAQSNYPDLSDFDRAFWIEDFVDLWMKRHAVLQSENTSP